MRILVSRKVIYAKLSNWKNKRVMKINKDITTITTTRMVATEATIR